MKDYSSQEAQILTVRKRNIAIKLSDADCESLVTKATSVGLTVDELLCNFIGDLIDGTYTNGSDERMYVNEWFNRCSFGNCQEGDLLDELLNSTDDLGGFKVKSFLNIIDKIKILKNSIANYETFNKSYESDIQDLREDLEDYLIDYHSIIDDFLEYNPKANLDKEIAICRKWLAEYEKII